MIKTALAALQLAGGSVPPAFFCQYANYTFTFYTARPIIAIKQDDDPDSFLGAPGDGFLAMAGKTRQKLQPSGWPVVYHRQGLENRSWQGLVLLRKQAAKAAAGRCKQGVVSP